VRRERELLALMAGRATSVTYRLVQHACIVGMMALCKARELFAAKGHVRRCCPPRLTRGCKSMRCPKEDVCILSCVNSAAWKRWRSQRRGAVAHGPKSHAAGPRGDALQDDMKAVGTQGVRLPLSLVAWRASNDEQHSRLFAGCGGVENRRQRELGSGGGAANASDRGESHSAEEWSDAEL
jgi:hypothetical protein